MGNTHITAAALSPYIGRYAAFQRSQCENTSRLIYRQESSAGKRIVAAAVFCLGVGLLVYAYGSLSGANDSRELNTVSIAFQLFLGGMLTVTGLHVALETATISFDKVESSVRFVRRVVFPFTAVTADLANYDSLVVRPTNWGGGVQWHCVYLTGNDNRTEFGLFAEPNLIAATRKAQEVSSFLELPLTSEDA